jgi:hypothetical protein
MLPVQPAQPSCSVRSSISPKKKPPDCASGSSKQLVAERFYIPGVPAFTCPAWSVTRTPRWALRRVVEFQST